MFEENGIQKTKGEKILTRVGISVLAILVLFVLGGLIYTFITPVP